MTDRDIRVAVARLDRTITDEEGISLPKGQTVYIMRASLEIDAATWCVCEVAVAGDAVYTAWLSDILISDLTIGGTETVDCLSRACVADRDGRLAICEAIRAQFN